MIVYKQKTDNVDTHLVVQRSGFYEKEFDKVVLVSGDVGHKRMINRLIEKQFFCDLLMKNTKTKKRSAYKTNLQ